ncbi:phosphoribosylanthranilate isomerase [Convivina intestini]|uniref:N-(5'-phosphoribosyl)anthranilate isomerase n=1 Tax=Convivina intestini TaxID=1505726 RepID=A0A2U1DEZ1_9LACO|nr:phosphoribosylanthranilate isomerase [Convivina intestini]PVY86238.1 phosphoribosylanthranilate isomerase [Convivina intestini]CAH1851272.1 N-(5'-phosphoribosyl)anthranilate isomerase [Convivina intestini]SDB81759.1 phosphoribosylanthranilate isomerase [Leuconostocaceae bacterium R-53105]
MTKIKLCGNFRLADVAYLNQVQPDFAGIILAPGHRRSVDRDLAKAMRRDLDPKIPLVGVFVNQDLAEILAYQGIIQYVQLHGQEDERMVAQLQAAGLPVIQVMQPGQQVTTQADYRLVDAGAGSGQNFDWQLLEDSPTPTILAGGLNVDNLATAIAQTQPAVVDISSGSEVAGLKDLATMQRLVQIVRELS